MRIAAFKTMLDSLQGIYDKDNPLSTTPEQALENLKAVSGQDFGYDVDMWTKYGNGELDEHYYDYVRSKSGFKIRKEDNPDS